MENTFPEEHPHKRLGTLLLKDSSVEFGCRKYSVMRCSRPQEFIPFTSERDGIGRILSLSSNKLPKQTIASLDRTASRRLSVLPPLTSQFSNDNGNYVKGYSSTNGQQHIKPSNQQLTLAQETNLNSSIVRMFVQDKQQLERRIMMKMLSQKHVKIVRAPLQEKQTFPIGFYDTNEANLKHRRSPQHQIQPLRKKRNEAEQLDEKPSPKKRNRSLTLLRQPIGKQSKEVYAEQSMKRSRVGVFDISAMEKNPELERVARMSRLSIKVFHDFDESHNLFKEKMKMARMKAIQIKQKIDSI